MEKKYFRIIDGKKTYPVPIGKILCFEARRVRVVVYTVDGKEYIHDRNLGTVMQDAGYDPCLLLTHRSCIVNINHVHCIESRKTGYLELKTGRRMKVSRSHHNELQEKFFGGNHS